MISIGTILAADVVHDAVMFGDSDRPVYVRLPDGSLHQLDSVEAGQVQTAHGPGPHDVIVLVASAAIGEEAV